MLSWGEADPEREYAEASAKGEAALHRLLDRRYAREQRYWAPIRAADKVARDKARQEAIDEERAAKAEYMRDYRARKAEERAAVDAARKELAR